MATSNPTNEIKLIRLYDAPIQAVWDAYTDPKRAATWWGPRGFTLTTHSKDLRSGGSWDYTMHGPDGVDFPNYSKFLEVQKPTRLVYDHGGNANLPPMFRVTVLFTDFKGKTQMDMTMTLPSPEAAERIRKYIKKAGGDACWDRFAEYLAKESTGKELFVINRSFEAPLERVFDMWSDPTHFSQWLAPTGFTMKFSRADLRPGGSTFYEMTDGKNVTMYGRAEYLEISRPNRIVYTQQFCDENEKVSRHPFAPTWPEKMLTTVTFAAEGPNRTRLTVVWEVQGQATPEELETFVKARSGMTQGWTGSFDKLEAYLAERSAS